MEDLQGIYIIDMDGNPIFTLEFHKMGENNEDYMLLSNFLSAFQSFTTEIDEAQQRIKILDFSRSKILFCEYKEAKIKFIIKCDRDIKVKKFRTLLDTIENLFLNIFMGSLNASDDVKGEKLKEFHEKVLDLLENKQKKRKVENFLGTL